MFSMVLWGGANSCCNQWVAHVLTSREGTWEMIICGIFHTACYYIDTKPGQFNSWKVCVEGQMNLHAFLCSFDCKSSEVLQTVQKRTTGSIDFVWKDNDALQTLGDTFSSTSWGFSYMSPININRSQADKSACIALKMYLWRPGSQQQK